MDCEAVRPSDVLRAESDWFDGELRVCGGGSRHEGRGRVFTGDCLFVGDCGRVDLPGSSVEDMYASLFDKVRKMDDALIVCPGHHYGKTPLSTIGEEKRTNFTLRPRTLAEFTKFMATP